MNPNQRSIIFFILAGFTVCESRHHSSAILDQLDPSPPMRVVDSARTSSHVLPVKGDRHVLAARQATFFPQAVTQELVTQELVSVVSRPTTSKQTILPVATSVLGALEIESPGNIQTEIVDKVITVDAIPFTTTTARKTSIVTQSSSSRGSGSATDTPNEDLGSLGDSDDTPSTPSESSTKSKTPAIVGGVVGAVVAVALMALAVWFWRRRQRKPATIQREVHELCAKQIEPKELDADRPLGELEANGRKTPVAELEATNVQNTGVYH